VTFTDNPTGTRATMADASGTTTYGYDARDRMLTKAAPAGTVTYTYDSSGNLASLRSSNANGASVEYGWDAANQLVSVTDDRAGGVTIAAYTPTGRPSTLTQPSGVVATYAYDGMDRATSLSWQLGTSPAIRNWSYEFNGRGQRSTMTDVTGRHVSYGYDAIARLTSENISNASESLAGNGELDYALDPTGNRLSRTSTLAPLGVQTLTYDANDELSSDGFDANGNSTSSGGHTYAYDFENRRTCRGGSPSACRPSIRCQAPQRAAATTISFGYSAMWRSFDPPGLRYLSNTTIPFGPGGRRYASPAACRIITRLLHLAASSDLGD
jgi:YD repeat-containing protein